MDYIYSISVVRGQAAPEILYLSSDYEKSIIAFYELCSTDFSVNWIEFNKFPANQVFTDKSYRIGSKVKMTKSSKYRIKFKSLDELKKEYLSCKRNQSLEEILS